MKCLNCETDIGDSIGLCEPCRLKRQVKVPLPEFERRRLSFDEMFPYEVRSKVFQGAVVFIFFMMFLRSAGCSFHLMSPFHLPPGITVPEEPQQTGVPPGVQPWKKGDFTITPLAKFTIRARVLVTAFYSLGVQSEISPYDFTLGWGIMSDTTALRQIEFTHFFRFVGWSADKPPYPWPEINAHVSNLHAIPANHEITAQLSELSIDDVVTMDGYLVNAYKADGSGWGSSLTRNDTGNGACETMWIERVTVQK